MFLRKKSENMNGIGIECITSPLGNLGVQMLGKVLSCPPESGRSAVSVAPPQLEQESLWVPHQPICERLGHKLAPQHAMSFSNLLPQILRKQPHPQRKIKLFYGTKEIPSWNDFKIPKICTQLPKENSTNDIICAESPTIDTSTKVRSRSL